MKPLQNFWYITILYLSNQNKIKCSHNFILTTISTNFFVLHVSPHFIFSSHLQTPLPSRFDDSAGYPLIPLLIGYIQRCFSLQLMNIKMCKYKHIATVYLKTILYVGCGFEEFVTKSLERRGCLMTKFFFSFIHFNVWI